MTDNERLEYYITKEKSGCWIWSGGVRDGAPSFHIKSKNVVVRRHTYKLKNGVDPDGCLHPSCGNALCVNPDHSVLTKTPNQGPRKFKESAPTWNMTIPERFFHYIEKTDSCWLWKASTFGKNRYGAFGDGSGKTVGAHRYSYELHYGPIPEGMYVCHTCDNPKCVNPDHLFLGSPRDNSNDRDSKGRSWYPSGDNHHLSKLTDKQILEIKSLKGKAPQKEIAKMFGVSPSHISRIMSGDKRTRISASTPP